MIAQKKSAKHQVLWITNNIKRLSSSLARRTNTNENWPIYHNLKKEVQQLCRSSHNNYVLSLLDPRNKCAKKFWKYIKSMHNNRVSINTLQVNGKPYSDRLTFLTITFTKDNQLKKKIQYILIPCGGLHGLTKTMVSYKV